MTRTSHGFPTRIEIESDGANGLGETSYARREDLRSVSERRLVHRIGVVDVDVLASVGRTLRTFLEI